MKQKILLAITMSIACSFITKPFSFTIGTVDPSGVVKAKLEKSTAMIQTKGNTSLTSSSYTIGLAKSPVRIKIRDAVFQSSSDDPNSFLSSSDYISLYRLTSDKKNRSFTINTDGTTNAALIPINFIAGETRLNTKLMPAQALLPGEYAFVDMSTKTADGNITIWGFGIDN